MTPLVPEKRTDRNGRAVTRHVRAGSPASKSAAAIPPPRAAKASDGSDRPEARLRPKQREQQRFVLKHLALPSSPALGQGPTPYQTAYEFTASAAEFYDVLSVAAEADAVRLLRAGCRSAEEASEKLARGGGEPLDRRELVDELLRRNISPQAMAEYGLAHGTPAVDAHSVKAAADAVELYAISALRTRDLYFEVLREVLDGQIRIEDIKAVGVTRLKTGSRLQASKELLRTLACGDAKFTAADVRWALDECAPEGSGISARTTTAGLYGVAAFCLLHGGRDLFDRGFEMRLIDHVYRTLSYLQYGRTPEMYEAVVYELEARKGTAIEWDSKAAITEALVETHRAGVPAKQAGELIASGMTAEQVIAVHRGEAAKPLAEGWL